MEGISVGYAVMLCLPVEIHSEKCILGWFCHCVITERTYTWLDGEACHFPGFYVIHHHTRGPLFTKCSSEIHGRNCQCKWNIMMWPRKKVLITQAVQRSDGLMDFSYLSTVNLISHTNCFCRGKPTFPYFQQGRLHKIHMSSQHPRENRLIYLLYSCNSWWKWAIVILLSFHMPIDPLPAL